MTIRILHIFAPTLKTRFSGAAIRWKNIFEHWCAPDVAHFVLDYEKRKLVESKKAFEFDYPAIQKGTSQWARVIWIINLFRNLIRYKANYDILHVHVLWWGSLLIGPWANWNGIPALYESVLLDSDTPGGIIKEKFGRVKVYFLKLYKAILAISEYLAEDYRSFGFLKEQVFTLTNCVDTNLFFPPASTQAKIQLRQEMGFPTDAMILVFVGSVIERKGVDLLIKAFIEASSAYPDLYLLIVGPKDKHENPSLDEVFVNNLRGLIDQNSLSDRIIFIGLVQDRKELANIYRASDIFVFPSRNEGLGNVVLEAMASGLPVVVSRLPVLEKIVIDNDNGIFPSTGTSDALKDSILMLIDRPSMAKKLGYSAQKYVQATHGFSQWQSQLIEFYQRLVS